MKKRELKVLILTMILCAFGMDSWAVNYYSRNDGTYANNNRWSTTSHTGPSCNCQPSSFNTGDTIFINHDLTGGPATISVYTKILTNASLTLSNTNLQSTLELIGNSSLTISGSLTNNSSNAAFITSANSTISISGSYTLNGGSFTHNGTMTFTGNGVSLTNNSSGVITTINGSIIFKGNNSSFVNNNGTMTVNGSVTFEGNGSTVTANSPITINGALNTTGNNTSLTINGSGTLNVNGEINISGNGTSVTNNGNLNINGEITVSGGGSNSFTNNGSGSITGAGTIDLPAGTTVNQFGTVNGSTSSQGGTITTGGSTNLSNTSNINHNREWNGNVSIDWSNPLNWTPNTVPSEFDNIKIPKQRARYPKFSGDTLEISTIQIDTGEIDITDATLIVRGKISGSGHFRTSQNSVIHITGNRTLKDTIQFEPGIRNPVKAIKIDRDGNIRFQDTVEVYDFLEIHDSLATEKPIYLKATGTSNYGQISKDNGIIEGDIIAEKQFANTNEGYRQIAFPLIGNLSNFSGINIKDDSHNDTAQQNIYYWDASPSSGTVAKGWRVPANTANQTRAYTIFGSNNTGGLHTIGSKINFRGSYNKADRTFQVYNTYDPFNTTANSARGWNLIPNPFPSNLSISDLFANNFSGITYKAIHVFNPSLGQYVAICSTGVSLTDYNTSDTSNAATVLAPFQAFWIKVNADGNFQVKNSNRTLSKTGLQVFMKKSPNYVRLNLFDQDSAFDQIVLYPTDQGNIDLVNEGEDAYKLYSMDWAVPTFAIENGADILSIKAFNSEDEIIYARLRIESFKTNNTHNIYLNSSQLEDDYEVYLLEVLNGDTIEHNLRERGFSFKTKASLSDPNLPEIYNYTLKIIKKNNSLSNNNKTEIINKKIIAYEAYDFSGNLLYKGEQRPTHLRGFYILKSTYEDKSVKTEKFYTYE